MARKVVYEKYGSDLRVGDKALTVDQAKELIGWVSPKNEAEDKKWGGDFLFRDLDGNKVRLENSPNNRPFRLGLAKRYMLDHLRGKWHYNGESMIFDKYGRAQSCQHRLAGFILASQALLLTPDKWKQYGVKGELRMEALIATGISDKNEVADTIDIGQKRGLGDVIFRRHEFKENGTGEKEKKKMSNVLAGAIRLVWIRLGGKTVSAAPHFPHSEALEFFEKHPKILDAVKWIYNEEGGKGAEGGKISSNISLAYAAGMMYLMGTAKSDPEGETIVTSTWTKAEKFWTAFGSGANLEEGNPVLTLQKALRKSSGSGGSDRDILCGMIVKAWNAYIDGEKLEAKDIRIKMTTDPETGKRTIAEFPRIGGLDIEREPVAVEEAGGYGVGDKCWVYDKGGAHWSGTIAAFVDDETAEVVADKAFRDPKAPEENDNHYEVAVNDLREDNPAPAGEEAEAA